ncbi:MAG: alpha-L-fucosidase, partial [Clostridia bacterium]
MEFLEKMISYTPNKPQYQIEKMGFYAFAHFGMNTFTGKEWGDGKASPSLFNPTDLDTDQWCRVLRDSGMKGIIATAKHHDGFCLWDTKTTDYSVKNSPFKKDVLALLRASCDKYGLKLGV